ATETALPQRGKISPVPRRNRLLYGVYSRNYHHECTSIERMLYLKLVRIRHTRARNRFGIWARSPCLRGLVPSCVGMLHLGPDEVVSSIRHGTIRGRINPRRHRAAHQLAPGHQLDLGRIPYFCARWRRECVAVLPSLEVERALIDRAGRRHLSCVTVHTGRRRQPEL